MRICFDLDGVICELRREGQSYAELEPVAGAVAKLCALRRAGHTIIIHTGRHMKTCGGNAGLVLARQGLVTLQWLDRHGVPFDEIYFGKPWADVYVDDNALRFNSWDEIEADGSNLPVQREHALAAATAEAAGALPELSAGHVTAAEAALS
ncbi:MAG: capsular biosynthesis protein [Pyrinomonadaceae bacterium]